MCQPAIGRLGLEYKQNDNTMATCMCQGVNEGIKYFLTKESEQIDFYCGV
jgi:hypothetical protein